jgi:hypothetical protein
MDARDHVIECEHLAEAAYASMYDAGPRGVKDCYDDARSHFTRAIDAARAAGLDADAQRLSLRLEHVKKVYNNQFRYVGR